MPLSKHYGGHGEKVMARMKKEYGHETAKRVFYATENKRKNKSGMAGRLCELHKAGKLKKQGVLK